MPQNEERLGHAEAALAQGVLDIWRINSVRTHFARIAAVESPRSSSMSTIAIAAEKFGMKA